ncbi:MAG: acyltransferase [Planctomycetota bacterium]
MLVAKTLCIRDLNAIKSSDELTLFGLDSLSRYELADLLLERFGFDPLQEMEDAPTIEKLVEAVAKQIEQKTLTERPTLEPSNRPSTLHPVSKTSDIELAIDDLVPKSISLIIGYDDDISDHVVGAFQAGLNAFPHFAGRIQGELNPLQLIVESTEDGIPFEWGSSDSLTTKEWESVSSEHWTMDFLPSSATISGGLVRSPLLAVKTTRLKDGGSVLGLFLSHMLVDGVGLGLFFLHCAAAHRDVPAPTPIHDRSMLASNLAGPAALPSWYRTDRNDESIREWDLAEKSKVCVFSIGDRDLPKRLTTDNSGPNAWYGLTSFLCHQLSRLSGLDTVAMWCDLRGSLSIPRTYSGNVGCYWHERITEPDDGIAGLASRLRTNASAGSSHVQAIYRAVKQRQLQGESVRWCGTEPNVLPVNLVPFSMEPLDLGVGKPRFLRNLTRNLHGLRISRAPQRADFIVEVCLPNDLPHALVSECCSQGLNANVLSMES